MVFDLKRFHDSSTYMDLCTYCTQGHSVKKAILVVFFAIENDNYEFILLNSRKLISLPSVFCNCAFLFFIKLFTGAHSLRKVKKPQFLTKDKLWAPQGASDVIHNHDNTNDAIHNHGNKHLNPLTSYM